MYNYRSIWNCILSFSFGQKDNNSTFINFLTPSDTINIQRVHTLYYGGGTIYLAGSAFLYHHWYKDFKREKFHFFNDRREWHQMDKYGHIYSAYQQMHMSHLMAQWTGTSDKKALNTSLASSLFFQTTIEVMDGLSSKWGFSLTDIAANIAGSELFYFQEKEWDKQVFGIKFSTHLNTYSNKLITSEDGTAYSSISDRAEQLFGTSIPERFLKDYNAQIYWLSMDINHFLSKETFWPDWLNVAIGYSAENMLGGFENRWIEGEKYYSLSPHQYPRYQQFYIGLDLDIAGFKSKHPVIKTLQDVFSIIKIPAPALEINTRGEIIFHLLR